MCSMTIDGNEYALDLQMSVKFDFWEDRLHFETIFDRLDPNAVVELSYVRNGEVNTTSLPLTQNKDLFREFFPEMEPIPYCCFAGMIVMELTHNHIPIFARHNLFALMNRPGVQERSVLLITHMLPECPFHESETIGPGDIIVGINNHMTQTLAQFASASARTLTDAHAVTLRCRDGSLSTALTKTIQGVHRQVVERYDASYVGYFDGTSETPQEAFGVSENAWTSASISRAE